MVQFEGIHVGRCLQLELIKKGEQIEAIFWTFMQFFNIFFHNRKLRPPIMPVVNHPGDHQNFEDFDDDEEFASDEATDEDRDKFKDF